MHWLQADVKYSLQPKITYIILWQLKSQFEKLHMFAFLLERPSSLFFESLLALTITGRTQRNVNQSEFPLYASEP